MSLPARISRTVPGKSAVKAEAKKERTAAGHVELIRQLSCAVTGAPPRNDPHHLMRAGPGERGLSLTAAGKWTIPLCRKIHDEITKKGDPEAFLMERYGLDARALAQSLWAASPDLDAMETVAFKARQASFMRRQAVSISRVCDQEAP